MSSSGSDWEPEPEEMAHGFTAQDLATESVARWTRAGQEKPGPFGQEDEDEELSEEEDVAGGEGYTGGGYTTGPCSCSQILDVDLSVRRLPAALKLHPFACIKPHALAALPCPPGDDDDEDGLAMGSMFGQVGGGNQPSPCALEPKLSTYKL